jgi:hypothetical protein
MATITTKYDIGDTVWHEGLTTEVRQHPCPDCKGSRKWVATSPAGGSFDVPCPRCSASYQSSDPLNLKYSVWVPTARKLTIGSIRANTASDEGNSYMCLETGVGSGSVYYEAALHETEAEALAAAEIKAAINNADADGWVAQQFNKTAQFCDYELKDAEMAAAKSASSTALNTMRYLLEDIETAFDLDEAKQRIADWREKQDA